MVSPIDRLKQIVERLRSPDGCPWDREQTHASLKPHIIEECYELIDAIDDQDDEGMQEELGDVLLQVVLHAQMASEEGRFDFDSVAEVISEKLIRRHPHVFGDTKLATSDAVLKQWDAIKRGEKTDRESALDGVPRGLPGLAKAQKMQSKAARVGFDWPDAVGSLEKVKEEIREIEQAGTGEKLAEELGDLLFSVVNFARKSKLDAEELLQAANRKFSDRFRKMEALAVSRGLNFSSLTLSEMDQLWNDVKRSGSSPSGA
jgi:tetrapyrrole methylase family protein/MazG family protein